MHILFVTPYAPNAIRTRPYNLVRQLNMRGHEVTLLTLYTNADEQADLDYLQGEGINVISEPLTRARSAFNVITTLPSPEPLQSAYCWQPNLAQRLEAELDRSTVEIPFDIIHVEHLRGARYALRAQFANDKRAASEANGRLGNSRKVPIVWDSVDSISHLFRQTMEQNKGTFGRWIARFELPRTERYEGWLAWQFDRVLVTSSADREAMLQQAAIYRADHPSIHVLPNGVDLDYFRPEPAVVRDPYTVILTGKFSYHANVSMAQYLVNEVMPLVWASRPAVRVLIVGKDPTAEVRALATNEAVSVIGTVPDLRPYLHHATLAVAPTTYGAGIQNKVLEAMACGTPVVASPLAARALLAVPDRDIVIASDAPSMADAIVSLLDDPERRSAIAAAGREYVESHHRWSGVASQLEKIYESILPKTTTSARPVATRPLTGGVIESEWDVVE